MHYRRSFAATWLMAFMCVMVLSFAASWAEAADEAPLPAIEKDSRLQWVWRNPAPQGNNLNGVAYGNNTYVAVGDYGTILTSPDGVKWTVQNSRTTMQINGVVYGNGMFVAVGTNGSWYEALGFVLTSPDGVTWTQQNCNDAPALNAVTYGNGTFVAVGSSLIESPYIYSSTILSSHDGVAWTVASELPKAPRDQDPLLTGVAYGNGTFVAVGVYLESFPSFKSIAATSPDGVSWTTVTGLSNVGSGVAFGNGIFVAPAGNRVLISSDGLSWMTWLLDSDRLSGGISYGNGVFTATGRPVGTMYASSDGVQWTEQDSRLNIELLGVAYGKNGFVAVGRSGAISASPDGATWSPMSSGQIFGLQFVNVAYLNDQFFAVGYAYSDVVKGGTVFTSPDGANWTPLQACRSGLYSIAYGNGMYVAMGVGGHWATSSDGITWTGRSAELFFNGQPGYGVAFGNNTFVAVGGYEGPPGWTLIGAIYTSPDGITWTRRFPELGTRLLTVTYANGLFVAAGDSGLILTSPDGIAWTVRSSGTSHSLLGVAYGNNTFVAVGTSNTSSSAGTNVILTSPEGATWSLRSQGKTVGLWAVTWGGKVFAAVGQDRVLTSPDGITWTAQSSVPAVFPWLWGIAYGVNSFVTAGNGGGYIFQSIMTNSLNITAQGAGSGVVVSQPSGINCGASCLASFAEGIAVTLTATPAAGSAFGTWTGCDSTSRTTCTVAMTSDRTVGVSFTLISETLAATRTGTGTGILSATGLTCSGNSCTGTYPYNTPVTITATPGTGSAFSGWSGCDSTSGIKGRGNKTTKGDSGTTCTITMTSNKSISAAFTLNPETLTATRTGAGQGTISATGLTCSGNSCTGTYSYNTSVTLTATAATGSAFSGWSGCDSTSGIKGRGNKTTKGDSGTTCTITMTSNKSISAAFTLNPETLTATRTGAGQGTISATGLTCSGNSCTGTYSYNTSVTLTATAATGSAFSGWSGCDSTSGIKGRGNKTTKGDSGTTCTITMTSNKSISAAFTLNPETLTATRTGAGQGTIAATGLTCSGSTCTGTYSYNTSVTLTATAATGSAFSGWSGCDSTSGIKGRNGKTTKGDSGTTCTITMTSNKSISAAFTLNPETLTATRTGAGQGTISATGLTCSGNSCTGTYPYGTSVTLTATAATGSAFGTWTGCDSTSGTTCTITMTSNKSISAAFTLNPETLTATKTGTGTGTLSATGLTCSGSTCTGTYPYNTPVTITATPATGSAFSGWSGCDSTSGIKGRNGKTTKGDSGTTCTITMTSNKSISAAFTLNPETLTATKTGAGQGTITATGLTCSGTSCTGTYPYSTSVTLTATAATGSYFGTWTGCDSTSGTTCIVAMTSNKRVSAAFYLGNPPKTLTATVTGTGTVSATGLTCSGTTCTGRYAYNTQVRITARPGISSVFSGWTGCDSSSGAVCTVTMKSDKTVSAAFTAVSCTYNINPSKKVFTPAGGSVIVTVTGVGAPSCSAPKVISDSWITATSSPFVNSRGTVRITVPRNATAIPKSGTVTIGGKTFEVSQTGVPCTLNISPVSKNITSSAQSHPFSVITPTGCAWTAGVTSGGEWLTSEASGNGNGSVTYDATQNPTKRQRVGKIQVSLTAQPATKKVFTVTQQR